MTALRADNVYPLRMEEAIGLDGASDVPPAASIIADALAKLEPEAPAKPKKPRKKKSATGRKRGRPVKAKAEAPTVPETPRTTVNMLSSAGDAGPRMWWRRINSDGWLIIAAVTAMLALGSALPFLTGVLKP